MNTSLVPATVTKEAWDKDSGSGLQYAQPFTDSENRHGPWAHAVKRTVDILGGGFLLILLAPIMLLIAAFICLTFSGPVLYCNTRVGIGGKGFICYKFRTMIVGAQEYLDWYLDNNPRARSEWGQNLKLKKDPRVTLWGRFLRIWSLDELPQLWNVVRGDMSLVGPRPMMPGELEAYGAANYRQAKPGITGLWQVSGRNCLTFYERACLDSWYIDNWTLMLDIKLLLRTVSAVLGRKGAF
ncbi:MAG: sugar transferase [Deltaproteobacteria bacterium]